MILTIVPFTEKKKLAQLLSRATFLRLREVQGLGWWTARQTSHAGPLTPFQMYPTFLEENL